MPSLNNVEAEMLARSVVAQDAGLNILLQDGRSFQVPYGKLARLAAATSEQRRNFRMIADGEGIHWPELNEDLSIRGLFRDFSDVKKSAMEEVPRLIAELYRVTRRLGGLFSRPFTPDGHLVGSIGEVVAEYLYDLVLENCSTPQIDAHTRQGQTVQIKLTGEQGKSFGFRWSGAMEIAHADLLVCLKLTSSGFEEIYAGEFPVDFLTGRADSSNGQLAVGVAKLKARNPATLPQVRSLAQFNALFLSDLEQAA